MKLTLRTLLLNCRNKEIEGALGRIDNAIVYSGLDDVFEIAAKYAAALGVAHGFTDANKRTGLAVALEYLSLNDYELEDDDDRLADTMVALIIGELTEVDFSDILYGQWQSQQP
ncbi:type II toxin-antitoxin system death-on-curing family toxin [Neiella litorisoli]|uniref:type II toxin-antitoxin system death-on-curing family toxin n=1 Tax=Neiella litorisoli TaxID=2771431 RepID=UPI0034E2C7E3